MENDNLNKYYQSLLQYKISMKSLPFSEQDQLWLQEFEKCTESGYTVQSLPMTLALIHPDFYYKDCISITNNLPWKNNHSFKSGITKSDICQYIKYTKTDFVFNKYPMIRGRCQADHLWPNSLGGPSIIDNRLILCKIHISMISFDTLV